MYKLSFCNINESLNSLKSSYSCAIKFLKTFEERPSKTKRKIEKQNIRSGFL